MRELLSGNEAIAEGIFEAGVKVAAGYPGTPSTEILQNVVKHPQVYAEWCPNEKVALEVAFGASVAGRRSIAVMKHVGLNVAADPLFTFSYTGVNGGCVIITADDPGMHSSQNEQDNRHYARAAKIPMFEPSNSQEAKDLLKVAFDVSERYDTPVLYRITTRVAHSSTIVELGRREEEHEKLFVHNAESQRKYVMVPANARPKHEWVEQRYQDLKEFANEFNEIEWKGKEVGIITNGVARQYAREVFPDASILKLSMSWPLPDKLIRELSDTVERLIVIEELDPVIEHTVNSLGIQCEGKSKVPITGELSPEVLRKAFFDADEAHEVKDLPDIPPRPPVMCPGCPHRGLFYMLKRHDLIVSGDIGCYTLAVLPPLSAMDTCLCMGASVSGAHGMEMAVKEEQGRRIVSVIGDSTFVHSGITGLVNTVYNKGTSTIIILDNRTTAMTGGQHHPATGRTLEGEETHQLDFVKVAEAVGVEYVQKFDPYDLTDTEEVLRRSLQYKGTNVLISTRPCILAPKKLHFGHVVWSNVDKCKRCGMCLKIGCPAIEKHEPGTDGKKFDVVVNPDLCIGCDLCIQQCKFDALKRRDD
jgi:indolepyruvate ferredoxin oxidoreductase alpha subunit